MNLREGTRRLALLSGVVGAILGGFASYLELRNTLDQRERHNEFEQLVNSDVVKQQQNSWPLTLRYKPEKAIEAFLNLTESQRKAVFYQLDQGEENDLVAKLKCEPHPPSSPAIAMVIDKLLEVPNHPEFKLDVKDDPYACLAETGDPPSSTVNSNGIETIHWTKGLEVDFLDMADGQTLYGDPAPKRWLYPLFALFPVIGFVIPWGVVHIIGWVGIGFVESSE